MNTVINVIEKTIENICVKNNAIYRKRLDRIEEAYAEVNRMISPNEDAKGRLHAPCDGYMIPQKKLDFCDFNECYEDVLFSKGEFLPIPVNDEYIWCSNNRMKNYSLKHRILLKNELLSDLKEINDEEKPFSLGFGKSWVSEDDTCAYVYISSCWKSVIDVFKENLEVKKVKETKKEEPKGIAPLGLKITVKATVIGTPLKTDYYGNSVLKLMVQFEDGATAFGTIPKKISDLEIGDVIEFKATFEPSNSKNHSYFKSPSASKILTSINDKETEVA